MAEKNNGLALQSIESEIQPGGSLESIVNSENRKANWNTQRIFVSAVDLINHILIVLVTIYIVYHSAKSHYVTNIHVILCTIGVSVPFS
ncbi:hypothetical protein X777_02190 [Ooceraea biroi]|uniref:Uncharacterized protein n=1 Tax=Ooceraea biroi TaxID=2015173 RepID=A0A026VSX1_OOCBI|nr:hypothetical protein X777_02190 [Ooceraea biroi]